MITAAPEIARRDSSNIITYIAPDNTWGYIGSEGGSALTCEQGKTCVARFRGTDRQAFCATSGGVQDSPPPNKCVNSYDFYHGNASESCNFDEECLEEMLTGWIRCTEQSLPYCGTFKFPEWGATTFSCVGSNATSVQTVFTAYAGQGQSARAWSTISATPTAKASPKNTETALSASPANAFVQHASSTSSSLPSLSAAPVGLIIGGTLGALAIIALTILGAIALIVRDRRRGRQWDVGGRLVEPYLPPVGFPAAPPSRPDTSYQHGSRVNLWRNNNLSIEMPIVHSRPFELVGQQLEPRELSALRHSQELYA